MLKAMSLVGEIIHAAADLVNGRDLRGLSGCLYSVVLTALRPGLPGLIVCITPGPEAAEEIALDLETIAPELTVLQAPVVDPNNPDRAATWVALLARLESLGKSPQALLLAPVASLLEPLPAPGEIAASNISLVPGADLKLEALFIRLTEAGLLRVEQVDEPGQFARRGGIIDIFPPSRSTPVRIEMFGDEIESVRAFDIDTQRSFESLDDGVAFPLVAVDGENRDSDLFDYLGDSPQIVVADPQRVRERIATLSSFHDDEEMRRRSVRAQAALEAALFNLHEAAVAADAPKTTAVAAARFETVKPINLGEGYSGVARLLGALIDSGRRCALCCGNQAELRLARESLAAFGVSPGANLELIEGDVGGGRVFPRFGLALLSLHELLGRARRRIVSDEQHRDPAVLIDDFVDLERGDYVVHLEHGIARYLGMENLKRGDKPGEFLALEFDGGLILHVPATNADIVQKYIGIRGEPPKLSHFNTQAWSERKLRAQQAVLKLAADMLEIQAIRAHEAGHACARDGTEMAEFEAACPFHDTRDQASSSVQIKNDMQSPKPMDRLICGDVGYGKTELAMRAAYKMALEGKQVAVLVPTTVLAQQHYMSFTERLANTPVIVDLLSRFRKGSAQRRTIEALTDGRVDIVIGTHRLLSQDVQFRDLGLVIIDEEQRFGVEHKERLKQMRRTVDLLTLTATPIPRTLHQALLGLRDISNLTTPPEHRHAVITRLMHWRPNELRDILQQELARDGQVFFVHNRVFDIEEIARRVRELVPNARVDVGHGQMQEGRLEQVMLRFMRGETDILVCTTIIESGIDVRNANTILIDQAQNYGLSDLHQLRGRVGRYHQQAYCYLMVPEDMSLSEIAAKRLKAILQYSALGSGFKIAMRDLELRGAGSLLGAEQSGHIATVGYGLYCRLLDRAVRKMRHEPVPPEVDTQLDLGLDLRIPREFIPSQKQRLEIYRRLARIASNAEADRFEQEICDRFGKPPRAFARMMTAALVRSRLAQLGITSVARGEGHLKFKALSAPLAQRKLKLGSDSFRVLDETTLALPLRKGLEHAEDQLRFLSNVLQTLVRHGAYRDAEPVT